MARISRWLNFLGLLASVISGVWFALAVVFPDRRVWNDSLLLIPGFVLTGLLFPAAALWRHDKVVARPFLWIIALVGLAGLVPLALYTQRLVAATSDPTSTLWQNEKVVSTIAATMLGCTAVSHLVTIGVVLYVTFM